MTQQEAREAAWVQWANSVDDATGAYPGFCAAWDAAKREDEHRIAALVAAARLATQTDRPTYGQMADLRAALRALADSEEAGS